MQAGESTANTAEAARHGGVTRALLLLLGLAGLEALLLRFAGSPAEHLRVARQLGDPASDPVAALLDLLAAVAETLAAYLVVVVALRLLAGLGGAAGRLAAAGARLLTVPVARRSLDAVLGTALVAFTLNPLAARAEAPPPPVGRPAAAATAAAQAIAGNLQAGTVLGAVNRLPRPAGGARATTAATASYTVEPGDTLWDIAAAHLPPTATRADVAAYWQQIYAANHRLIGADPDLIRAGQRLAIPELIPDFRPRR
jgi:nucleoid-associated protein YgaU